MPHTRRLFDQKSKEPFKLSRSKLELFLECPRCFYLDRRRFYASFPIVSDVSFFLDGVVYPL